MSECVLRTLAANVSEFACRPVEGEYNKLYEQAYLNERRRELEEERQQLQKERLCCGIAADKYFSELLLL